MGSAEKQMRKFRGNKVSIIFQDPMTSLNPVFTIGNQLMEAIRLHTGRNRRTGAAPARWKCSSWWASTSRKSASSSIPTSFPAACASA